MGSLWYKRVSVGCSLLGFMLGASQLVKYMGVLLCTNGLQHFQVTSTVEHENQLGHKENGFLFQEVLLSGRQRGSVNS